MTDARIRRADVRSKTMLSQGEKLCSHCHASKSLDRFEIVIRKDKKSRFSSWCKDCAIVMRRDRRQQEYYHLRPEDSEEIVEYQLRRCAICKEPMTSFKRLLATDHDHKTGLIRGKLCWFCNKIIAIAKDNPDRLLAAAVYLVSPPAVIALGGPCYGLPGRAGTKKQRKLAKKLKQNPVEHSFEFQNATDWLEQKIIDARIRTSSLLKVSRKEAA